MITSILTNDLLISFPNRDLLGIISYLLINYRSSKVNAGIKAVVFNKIGFYGWFTKTINLPVRSPLLSFSHLSIIQ